MTITIRPKPPVLATNLIRGPWCTTRLLHPTDLVHTPHVDAAFHLPLQPGTNVAVPTAIAHVIVTEGLVDEEFVRTRCDWEAFEGWAEFVADARNSPEATAAVTGVPAAALRGAARLYATDGNAAIYYGLGVTEHSQGSTTVMAIANLAMATGNIGLPGVGVNPLRGQNNVQGSCDMDFFPHELPGYRHISDAATRDIYEQIWGVTLQSEPGLRIPNMLDAAVEGTFKALYIQGEDIVQSDPDTKHVTAGLAAMECVVVQDLFLCETADYAHVFLPGSTFLEKDGTFTNAERRITPEGTPVMHMERFQRGLGRFMITEYIPTEEHSGPRFPLLLITGRILSQYNVGAQTRRTANVLWHDEDRLEIHPHDAEQRGVRDGDSVRLQSRAGATSLRARITDRVAPGVVYTTFHHPDTQANVVTTDQSDWATNCPKCKVTAVQVTPSNGTTAWQDSYRAHSEEVRRILPVPAAE